MFVHVEEVFAVYYILEGRKLSANVGYTSRVADLDDQ